MKDAGGIASSTIRQDHAGPRRPGITMDSEPEGELVRLYEEVAKAHEKRQHFATLQAWAWAAVVLLQAWALFRSP